MALRVANAKRWRAIEVDGDAGEGVSSASMPAIVPASVVRPGFCAPCERDVSGPSHARLAAD